MHLLTPHFLSKLLGWHRAPVVTSAGTARGTALVLNTVQTTLLDRQQVSVMASREDRDNFVAIQVTLLASAPAWQCLAVAPSCAYRIKLIRHNSETGTRKLRALVAR
ncbi:MAG TPA: hypothetical protein ENI17_15345 [Pseudomonas xinjiangensis]|uniref:Uncharacterized protein n=2 Tax=root TaxID=1 RepID=A0A7V1BRP6_9GAMM|nr:hypothetical protein [Halopseudomonas xinjiangensis]HEC48976.1 hypothetical protein [Halopseudomonas xinjiangensis]